MAIGRGAAAKSRSTLHLALAFVCRLRRAAAFPYLFTRRNFSSPPSHRFVWFGFVSEFRFVSSLCFWGFDASRRLTAACGRCSEGEGALVSCLASSGCQSRGVRLALGGHRHSLQAPHPLPLDQPRLPRQSSSTLDYFRNYVSIPFSRLFPRIRYSILANFDTSFESVFYLRPAAATATATLLFTRDRLPPHFHSRELSFSSCFLVELRLDDCNTYV